jgi:hypothetical protein
MNVVSLLMHEIFHMIFYLTVGLIEFLLEILEVFFFYKVNLYSHDLKLKRPLNK